MADFLTELWRSPDGHNRFIVPTIFWGIFALCQIPKLKTRKGWQNVVVCLGVALLAGTIGRFLPPILWPWFHLLIVPWIITPLPIIAIVLAVIAWAKYSYAKDKERTQACIKQLSLIEAAKKQWALEHGDKGNYVPTQEDLGPYLEEGGGPFTCPASGKYVIGTLKTLPTCSIQGHVLLR